MNEQPPEGAPSPVPEEVAYPRDFFSALISSGSPYAFYIFQWVPYQTDAKRWRLKMQHDVRTFDGREAFNIWPNGSSCGPFKDHEVEFIRISRSQFGEEWKDPRPPAVTEGAPQQEPTLRETVAPLIRNELVGVLNEAAEIIRSLPDDYAERKQIRHFLPDELEGCALMVQDAIKALSRPVEAQEQPAGEAGAGSKKEQG